MTNIIIFLLILFIVFISINQYKNKKTNSNSIDGYFNDKVRSARVVQKVTQKLKDNLEEDLFK